MMKRQTVVSQFYQLDRLVVEGGKTVSFISDCWNELDFDFGGAGLGMLLLGVFWMGG